jgi:DNA-binding MarR family transcriptional regulator
VVVPNDKDYERLLTFRTRLREFDHWSQEAAAELGLSHAQHQLLLAVRGHPQGAPTIGDVAAYLLVKPHTPSELAARGEALGLVERVRDDVDSRVVRLELTADGLDRLTRLTAVHLAELRALAPLLEDI